MVSVPHVDPFLVGMLAGVYNFFGMLLLNQCFTDYQSIEALDPNMWGPFSQLMILIWGLAFMSAALDSRAVGSSRNIWLCFTVEKAAFAYVGINAILKDSPADVWQNAIAEGKLGGLFAALFHTIYGIFYDEMLLKRILFCNN